MKINILHIVLIIFSQLASVTAQVNTISEGKADLRIEKNWTEEYAMNRVKEEAKINAIENAFGSVVNQGNTLYIKDTKTGKLNENTMVFNSISNVLVNGEWIKTIDEKVSFLDKDGYRWIEAVVKGEVRELTKIPFQPEINVMNCLNDNCISTDFKSGQQLILRFKSPIDGFVSVYLDDGKIVQKLLPYASQKGISNQEVLADKDYYFFYRDKNSVEKVDEIELFTNAQVEQNRLFVMFSKKDFSKPVLQKNDNGIDLPAGYSFPMQIPSDDFALWLQTVRSYEKSIQLKQVFLTIKK